MTEPPKLNLNTVGKLKYMQPVHCTIKQRSQNGYRVWINNDPNFPAQLNVTNDLAEDQVVHAKFFSIRGPEIVLIYDDDPGLTGYPIAPKDYVDWEVFLDRLD